MAKFNLEAYQTKPKVQVISKRKGLKMMCDLLQELQDAGIVKAGEIIYTGKIAQVILSTDEFKNIFNRNENRQDDVGVARSCGDLIGGHGLMLSKVGSVHDSGRYLMPIKLPIVNDNDEMIQCAVYKIEQSTVAGKVTV